MAACFRIGDFPQVPVSWPGHIIVARHRQGDTHAFRRTQRSWRRFGCAPSFVGLWRANLMDHKKHPVSPQMRRRGEGINGASFLESLSEV
jgi:hypothetical protein